MNSIQSGGEEKGIGQRELSGSGESYIASLVCCSNGQRDMALADVTCRKVKALVTLLSLWTRGAASRQHGNNNHPIYRDGMGNASYKSL